jgi:hypothetical protein
MRAARFSKDDFRKKRFAAGNSKHEVPAPKKFQAPQSNQSGQSLFAWSLLIGASLVLSI